MLLCFDDVLLREMRSRRKKIIIFVRIIKQNIKERLEKNKFKKRK
jgi:hypothetical protein